MADAEVFYYFRSKHILWKSSIEDKMYEQEGFSFFSLLSQDQAELVTYANVNQPTEWIHYLVSNFAFGLALLLQSLFQK